MSFTVSPDRFGENRLYWKLKKVLPKSRLSHNFENVASGTLHDNQWNLAITYGLDKALRIRVSKKNCMPPSPHIPKILFITRVGITGEFQEAAVSENIVIGSEYVFNRILINHSELESFMQKNKVLYFFLEVKKSDDNKTQDTKTRKRKIESDFEEMFLSGKNSDVTIEVGSKKFKCHKFILEARSPVFSAMMEHHMKEKATGIVTVQDAELSVFHEFLLYLYTGNEEHLKWKNITQLYKLGDKYLVEDLKSVCLEYMKKNISQGNLFQFFLLSQQHGESKLSEAAVEFFVKNSKQIVETENWETFLESYPKESNILIKAVVINK